MRGSLIQIIVRPLVPTDEASAVPVRGHLAGQPLHFERDATGAYRSLAGIPIGANATIPMTLDITVSPDSTEYYSLRVPVDSGAFGFEQLSVDPRFSAQPDSALQDRIRREARAARRVYEQSHDTERLWRGAFGRPIDGRITSPYGKGRMFNGTLRSRHLGTDFDGEAGDTVRAVNRGVVALVGDFYYSGNVVYVDHGAGLVTVYMHMSQILVVVGDTLRTGDVIGRVGATGRVTGPHLHLSAKYGTVTVNPLNLFEIDASLFSTPSDP